MLNQPAPAFAAAPSDLPPIFQPGAIVRLNDTHFQIDEVYGLWIQTSGRWIYVPNVEGRWSTAPQPEVQPPR
jgi:hypothetical protein